MVPDAYRFLLPVLIVAAAFALLHLWVPAAFFAVLGGFIAFFFRNPRRRIPDGERLILSPADGKVVRVLEPQSESGPPSGPTVSIFLSLFDVHLNRAPVDGMLRRVDYRPGRFKAAFRHEASRVNEQNVLTIDVRGSVLVVRQIAGVLARRVVCWKQPGQPLERGELIGLIRFGSRVDVVLPAGAKPLVGKGDRVKGGVSILGEFI